MIRPWFGGQPLPLEVVSPSQINALVPYGAVLNGTEELLVQQNGDLSFAEPLVLAASNPAIFTQSLNGRALV